VKSREDILAVLEDLLVNIFEVDPASIRPEARLYEDLEIDSIDAVDLVIELRKITGRQIDPDEFKSVRTVDDVVGVVQALIDTP
jgi:acyl carrier protein